MTADPRATARQWLAEVLHAKDCGCNDEKAPQPRDPYYLDLADAIVAGVEVTTILRPIDGSRRVALLLPAEEGDGT